MKAVKDWAIVVASGCLLVAMLVIGWMLFIDGTYINVPVVYDRAEFPVSQRVYTPGETVMARIKGYKGVNTVGQVQWSLVDGIIRYYAPRNLPLPRGAVDAWAQIEKIPDCASGRYHLEGVVTYPVNPIKTVTYRVRTEDFEIRNPDRPQRH